MRVDFDRMCQINKTMAMAWPRVFGIWMVELNKSDTTNANCAIKLNTNPLSGVRLELGQKLGLGLGLRLVLRLGPYLDSDSDLD